MRKMKTITLLYSLLALVHLMLVPVAVYATEGAGGQVNTGGKISFYEEKLPPEEPKPEPAKPTVKPKGNLPSTGEMIQQFWLVGIGLLLLLVLFVWRKYRRGN